MVVILVKLCFFTVPSSDILEATTVAAVADLCSFSLSSAISMDYYESFQTNLAADIGMFEHTLCNFSARIKMHFTTAFFILWSFSG